MQPVHAADEQPAAARVQEESEDADASEEKLRALQRSKLRPRHGHINTNAVIVHPAHPQPSR